MDKYKKLLLVNVILVVSFAIVTIRIFLDMNKSLKSNKELFETYKEYYYLSLYWFEKRNQGISIADILKSHNINSIGIYGKGTLCNLLLDELSGSKIDIKFIADKEHGKESSQYNIILPSQIIEYYNDVDKIIVTPVGHYESIYTDLCEMDVNLKSISLKAVIRQEL